MISKAIHSFDWDKAFLDKSTEEKVSILTKIILSIMSNFIPDEIVTTGDRDPPWINNKMKSLKIRMNILRIVSNHSHKKQIVWKNGPS